MGAAGDFAAEEPLTEEPNADEPSAEQPTAEEARAVAPGAEAPAADTPSAGDPGAGRRLGVDVGSVRIGVATSDPGAVLASPLMTIHVAEHADGGLGRLVELLAEYEVVEVVVGLPRTLADRHGSAAEHAVEFARGLASAAGGIAVRLADERLSTVQASRMLTGQGVRGRKKRAIVDQAAAVQILQGWLDARARNLASTTGAETGAGHAPGCPVPRHHVPGHPAAGPHVPGPTAADEPSSSGGKAGQ